MFTQNCYGSNLLPSRNRYGSKRWLHQIDINEHSIRSVPFLFVKKNPPGLLYFLTVRYMAHWSRKQSFRRFRVITLYFLFFTQRWLGQVVRGAGLQMLAAKGPRFETRNCYFCGFR